MKFSQIIAIIIIISFFSACDHQPIGNSHEEITLYENTDDKTVEVVSNQPDNSDSMPEIIHPDIVVSESNIVYSFIDPTNGVVLSSEMTTISGTLELTLNKWINLLSQNNISYGLTEDGTPILESLEILDIYIIDNEVVIVMNDTFKAFDTTETPNYTRPGDFIYGLSNVVSQLVSVDSMTIDFESKMDEVIHPEGIVINHLPLNDLDTVVTESDDIIFTTIDAVDLSHYEFIEISSNNIMVMVPTHWNYSIDERSAGSTDPFNGIRIYPDIDSGDSIYVLECVGHYNVQDSYTESTFTTDIGLEGQLLYLIKDSRMELHIIFDSGFKAVSINMDSVTFFQNEALINKVLKSITYVN